MRTHDLTHLSDADLLRSLEAHVAKERVLTATVLACVSEMESRGLPIDAKVAEHIAENQDRPTPEQVETSDPRPVGTPPEPERFMLECTIDQDTHDTLQYALALLREEEPSADLDRLFCCALEALIQELEQQEGAATGKPHPHSPRTR